MLIYGRADELPLNTLHYALEKDAMLKIRRSQAQSVAGTLVPQEMLTQETKDLVEEFLEPGTVFRPHWVPVSRETCS